MTNEEILKDINDEDDLRALRNAADEKLQKVKEEKRAAEIKLVASEYLDKYLIAYGNTFSGSHGCMMKVNENDITIVHVKSIDFKGRNFFRCEANVLKIEYDNEHEWLDAGLNSKDFRHVNIRTYSTPSFDIKDDMKFKIISKEEVEEFVKEAKTIANADLNEWDGDVAT